MRAVPDGCLGKYGRELVPGVRCGSVGFWQHGICPRKRRMMPQGMMCGPRNFKNTAQSSNRPTRDRERERAREGEKERHLVRALTIHSTPLRIRPSVVTLLLRERTLSSPLRVNLSRARVPTLSLSLSLSTLQKNMLWSTNSSASSGCCGTRARASTSAVRRHLEEVASGFWDACRDVPFGGPTGGSRALVLVTRDSRTVSKVRIGHASQSRRASVENSVGF